MTAIVATINMSNPEAIPPMVELRKCCDAIRGVTFASSEVRPRCFEGGIGCLTTSAVQDEVDWQSARFIPERFMRGEDQVLCSGDLLVSTANSKALVGKLAIARTVPSRMTFGAFVTVLRPSALVSSPYLFYCLRAERARSYFFEKSSETTNISNLRTEDLLAFEISLPPLAEQERIARRLTEQLAAVERARAAAQARLAAAEALPAAYLREVFDGPKASGWETRRLGDLLKRHNEIIHPGDRATGEAVFVGLEHIEPHTGRRIGSLTIDLGNLTGRKPTFRRGQIVYGYLRPYLNKVWIAEFDGCSSVDQFAFDIRGDIADITFVAAFMRSESFLRRSHVVTTTGQLPRISIDEIAAVRIDLPTTVQDQRRVAAALSAKLATAEDLTARCREELATTRALPAALLREAFKIGA